ncbi:hypothetical protein PHBOTO_001503 [Pseudozyma hubeiensis]|nr:hypothetical protein PHBOTO_001503 [Pseudozyma hubeiensis]
MLLSTLLSTLLSSVIAMAAVTPGGQAVSDAAPPMSPAGSSPSAAGTAADKQPPPKAYSASTSDSEEQANQEANKSVFGAGCRWDPTVNNIVEVTFQFRTGQAPPSTWFSHVNVPAAKNAAKADARKLRRRQTPPSPPPAHQAHPVVNPVVKPAVNPPPHQAPPNANPAAVNLPPHQAPPKSNPAIRPEVNPPAHQTPPKSNPAVNPPARVPGGHHKPRTGPVLDPSYHTPLIDVLTYRARYGSFGSSLSSVGCALPAYSERLAALEAQERDIVNNYTLLHKPDSQPSAMFFWAGISNYDPSNHADLIQTVIFYGDGCAANPRQGLCIYSAEYSDFRYETNDHMCMGSNMPVFYPIDTPMTIVYRTQAGFRTQEAWINGMMVSYLRSAGDQVMNSFVITQECKNCVWPLSEQVYENVTIRFDKPEVGFDRLQSCSGGARTSGMPRMEEEGRVWVIDRVTVPSGKHVTTTAADGSGAPVQGEAQGSETTQADKSGSDGADHHDDHVQARVGGKSDAPADGGPLAGVGQPVHPEAPAAAPDKPDNGVKPKPDPIPVAAAAGLDSRPDII